VQKSQSWWAEERSSIQDVDNRLSEARKRS